MILPAKKYENREKVKKDAIRARVTKAEKTEIQKWAKGAGEDVSAFLLNGAQSRHYALKKMPINIEDSTDFGNYSSASFGLLIDDLNDALSNIDSCLFENTKEKELYAQSIQWIIQRMKVSGEKYDSEHKND